MARQTRDRKRRLRTLLSWSSGKDSAYALPLLMVLLPAECSDAQYRAAMAGALGEARASGIEAVAFGDVFLADVRAYREAQLAGTGVAAVFPLWGRASRPLAREMVQAGLRAIVTCVDTHQLDRSFLGLPFDLQFLERLPAGVDPCGENGEFHTLAISGPMFSKELKVETGEVADRGRFVFLDVKCAALR